MFVFVFVSTDHTTNYEQVRAILRDQLSKQTSSIIRKGRRIDLMQIARDCLPTISNAAGANFQVSFLLALLKDMKKSRRFKKFVMTCEYRCELKMIFLSSM